METLLAIFVLLVGTTVWSLKWRAGIDRIERGFNSMARVEAGYDAGVFP